MSLSRFSLLCLVAVLCACEGRPPENPSESKPPAGLSASSEPISASTVPLWKTVGEFRAPNGFRYLYVVIPRPGNREGLVAAARAIHEKEPDAWLFLLDDEEKVPEILAANRSGDTRAFPAKWMARHLLGSTAVLTNTSDGRRPWVVYEGQSRSEPVAELPCIDGGGMCKD